MAPTEKGKRKTPGRRRWKAQRRSLPAKQKKQRKPRHAVKIGSRKVPPKSRGADGRRCLSTKAEDLMVSFVNDIYKQVLAEAEAEARRRRSCRPAAGPSQVPPALQDAVPEPRGAQPPAPVAETLQ